MSARRKSNSEIENAITKMVFEPKVQTHRSTGTGTQALNGEFDLDTLAPNIIIEGSGLFNVSASTAAEGTRFTATKKIKMHIHFNAGGPATQRGFSILVNGSSVALGTASITGMADSGHTSATILLNAGDWIAGWSNQSGFSNSQIILFAESRELVKIEDL